MGKKVRSLKDYGHYICWEGKLRDKCYKWGKDEDVKVLEYYNKVRSDLRLVLWEYGGVRLRDIKLVFQNKTTELDLDRLGMKSWDCFLLSAREDIQFRKDICKDEVLAYLSATASALFEKAAHKDDEKKPNIYDLVEFEAKEVFLEGYMNCADGVPMMDPRIPKQELGVAAEATKREAEADLKKERHVGKKILYKTMIKKRDDVVTIETTAPFETTQTGTIEAAMATMARMNILANQEPEIMSRSEWNFNLPTTEAPGASGGGSIRTVQNLREIRGERERPRPQENNPPTVRRGPWYEPNTAKRYPASKDGAL